MIATRRDQIRTVGTKRTVPHPSLVRVQARLQGERRTGRRTIGADVALDGRVAVISLLLTPLLLQLEVTRSLLLLLVQLQFAGGLNVDGPDPGVVVGAARGEMADIRGEENARYVGGVSLEGCQRYEGGDVAGLDHLPDEDHALLTVI